MDHQDLPPATSTPKVINHTLSHDVLYSSYHLDATSSNSLTSAAQHLSSPLRPSSMKSSRTVNGDDFWSLYELTGKILGFGGFALVYEAIVLREETWSDGNWIFQVEKGQRVAVKVCTTRRVNSSQIQAEMDLMRQLQHPNVCSVVDPRLYRFNEPLGGGFLRTLWNNKSQYFPPPPENWTTNPKENGRCHGRYLEEKDESPYAMVMSICDEGSLFDYIMTKDARKPRSVAQAKRLFFDIICGLDYLSRKLMVHQDLKIDNVFLCSVSGRDGNPRYNEDGSLALVAKIGDMGLSRYVGGGRESVPPWSELECVGREKCCHLSLDVRLGLRHPHYSDDIFSVGLALFEFFTKERLKIESSVALRKNLLAYMRSRPGWEHFQGMWPLLTRLLHESRLLRPKLEDLVVREPLFEERRKWLHRKILAKESLRGNMAPKVDDPAGLTYEATLLSLGRRDEIESQLKGHPVSLYYKSRGEDGKGQPLQADFIFSDLRDVLVQPAASCGGGDSRISLIVSASRCDWKTLTTRECSTCSAVLEAEIGPALRNSSSFTSSTSSAGAAMDSTEGFHLVDMMDHVFHAKSMQGENIVELQRRDGQPFHSVDKLFMGLFDRPRLTTREPFELSRDFYSWTSLWSLYQGLRQATHSIAPADASSPTTVLLPLVGMVFRQETGPSVFSSDDNARKFILQEVIGLLSYWASVTTETALSCIHVVSWNRYDKHLILEGLHGLDGDQVASPADLYQIAEDAFQSSAALKTEDVYPQLELYLELLSKASDQEYATMVDICYQIAEFLSKKFPAFVLCPSLDLAPMSVNHASGRLESSRSHVEVIKYNEHKRLYDLARAKESIYIPMTGVMEGARSVVAVAALFHLIQEAVASVLTSDTTSPDSSSSAVVASSRIPTPFLEKDDNVKRRLFCLEKCCSLA